MTFIYDFVSFDGYISCQLCNRAFKSLNAITYLSDPISICDDCLINNTNKINYQPDFV